MEITYHSIGVIHSPLQSRVGAPIQGRLAPETQGTVEVFEPFEEGLQDLEEFSHLILIYHFHLSEGYDLKAKPFIEDVSHGVFAIRAPRRPNSIGLSIVKLEQRRGRFLEVSEIDIIDQTPLLDIKPFVKEFDHRPDSISGWVEKHVDKGEFRTRADDRFK